MEEYTLSYSAPSEGFPSFYSYIPDYMVGMNNYFYSFKKGQLYRHNTNAVRNQYYGVNYSTTITSVFNGAPLENKLFKTLELESDAAWGATLTTDLPQVGEIASSFFEKKEANFFAFIRFLETDINLLMRYANGLGSVATVGGAGAAVTLTFAAAVSIGSIISIGDVIYYGLTPTLGGTVVSIVGNVITIDTTIAGGSSPSNGDFILYVKNTVAESHGVMGHYCQYTLTNSDTTKVEIFAVESSIMKSYP